MVSAAYMNNRYYLCPDEDADDYNSKVWNVISRTKLNKYGFKGILLKHGQILKFGRYVFKVNEISTDKSAYDNELTENNFNDQFLSPRYMKTGEDNGLDKQSGTKNYSPFSLSYFRKYLKLFKFFYIA